MCNCYEFIAIITARGGSKGIPKKNIVPVNGKPLIAWTIEAAMGCNKIKRVFVSTDDVEIARISENFGAETIERPYELATDEASSIDVVYHAINWLEGRKIFCDDFVLLQPTSPLRNANHLDEALTFYKKQKAELVISVFEPSHTPVKAYIENKDGTISGLYNEEAPYTRRQILPRAFQPNGAIYACSTEKFKQIKHFPRDNVMPYVMSKSDSTDIDTWEDIKIVESRMKELNVK